MSFPKRKKSYELLFYLEEAECGTAPPSAVLDLGLFEQILGRLYRWHHTFHCQEGRQVSGVGGDDDQSEEPPGPAHNARAHCPGVHIWGGGGNIGSEWVQIGSG